jgi:hypothetical protein
MNLLELFTFRLLCFVCCTGGGAVAGFLLDSGHRDDGKVWQDIPSTLGIAVGAVIGWYAMQFIN